MLGNYVVIIGANNSLKVWNIETQEVEGEFKNGGSFAEICLLENKYKHGIGEFITLNTSVKEDLESVGTDTLKSIGECVGDGYQMSSFFTYPKVQLI